MTTVTVQIKENDLFGKVMYIRGEGVKLNVYPEESIYCDNYSTYTEDEIAVAQSALLAS
jgi:hypothetical protein